MRVRGRERVESALGTSEAILYLRRHDTKEDGSIMNESSKKTNACVVEFFFAIRHLKRSVGRLR